MVNLLKEGSSGFKVKDLQRKLGIEIDGKFGPLTKSAVIKFQLLHNLKPDGIVGAQTWASLMGPKIDLEAIDQSTDTNEQYFETNFNQKIHKYHLPKGEYVHKKYGQNEYFFLHHTAGGDNPYKCIDQWSRDSRGRVSTEFVLGGQNYRTGDDEYDGVMVQAFPETGYGWHLGKTGSGHMVKHSVGLEICSIGYLDDNHYSYVGRKAHESQVITLDKPFRRKKHWHKYSDKQIEEIAKLIEYVSERDQIDMRFGLKQWILEQGPIKAFGFQEDAYYGKVKGLLSHTNVRKGKMDVYPDERLIDVILSL